MRFLFFSRVLLFSALLLCCTAEEGSKKKTGGKKKAGGNKPAPKGPFDGIAGINPVTPETFEKVMPPL